MNTIEFTPPPSNVAAVPHDFVARLSVEQYHEMLETGILQSGDPIELLEGWLVYKMPKNPLYPVAIKLSQIALDALVPDGWFVRQQDPITFEASEPEPDLAIVVGQVRRYTERHPIPSEVALIVEVSDSTLVRDQTLKQRIYAHGRIPYYWIINLIEHQVEVYSGPTGFGDDAKYLDRKIFRDQDAIPFVIENTQVGTIFAQDLLP